MGQNRALACRSVLFCLRLVGLGRLIVTGLACVRKATTRSVNRLMASLVAFALLRFFLFCFFGTGFWGQPSSFGLIVNRRVQPTFLSFSFV